MEKQYEPLINALLTDNNLVDVDKIYESLYVNFILIFFHLNFKIGN